MELNLRIRELRKARGWTIAELADRVHVSTPHMSEVERGKKNLNNHLLTRIAEALETTPTALIGEKPPEYSDFTKILDGLTPDDRDRVRAFAEALLVSQKA